MCEYQATKLQTCQLQQAHGQQRVCCNQSISQVAVRVSLVIFVCYQLLLLLQVLL